MARLTTRLVELEKRIQPVKGSLVIFKCDKRYWINKTNDYRGNIVGMRDVPTEVDGCEMLTIEEVEELERKYKVILVEYVSWPPIEDGGERLL